MSLSVKKIGDKMSMKFFFRPKTIKKRKKENNDEKFHFFCISRQNRELFFKFEINVCRHSNWKFSEFKNEIVTEKEYRVSECPISWLGKSKKKKIQSRSGNNGWRNKSVAERLSGAYSGILALQWCDDQQTKKKKKKKDKSFLINCNLVVEPRDGCSMSAMEKGLDRT